MTPLEWSWHTLSESESRRVMPQFGASLMVVIYAPGVINYAPREHVQYSWHSWWLSYNDPYENNMFIVQATGWDKLFVSLIIEEPN
jgi:hypothetical protein